MKPELDPREIRTLQKIKNALLHMMASRIDPISITDLCAEAQVTRPTFYKHFSSVAELMEVMSKETMEDLERRIVIEKKISLQEVDYDELPSNMVALFNHVLENRQFYEAFILIHPDTPFTRYFKATLYHFVKVGLEASVETGAEISVPSEVVINFMTGAFHETILWWMLKGYPYTPQEMTAMVLRLSINGPYQF
ncbi:TetR/AcrR family transcriptional regulator C-terminal domain-containing protein [Paenibacillus sp. Dod16]|uniref:TetR/AcrR family transcriptional regulator n=1 Tax=Paenibacillus sp. Dod16 TaxID=3416392 RepID=UPI003CEEDD66